MKKAAIALTIILIIIMLPSCTDKEFIQALCEKPEGFQERVLCWFLSSSNERQSSGSFASAKTCDGTAASCPDSCVGKDVMRGSCENRQCVTKLVQTCGDGYSCNVMDGVGYCIASSDKCKDDSPGSCPDKCRDNMVMRGSCASGQCAWKAYQACDTGYTCKVMDSVGYCQQNP
ncbi:MAG: hypothetical protein AABX47_04550 [Nanoarchaeota archaeon]